MKNDIDKTKRVSRDIINHRKISVPTRVNRSTSINRFAPNRSHSTNVRKNIDIAPVNNTVVQKTISKMSSQKSVTSSEPVVKSSAALKKHAINRATENMIPKSELKEVKSPKKNAWFSKKMKISMASIILLFVGSIVTYLCMPSLSVRIASMQAGIKASYPNYRPVGFRLSGPVRYKDGNVIMNFTSNLAHREYTLIQSESNWDSTAVLENYIRPKSGDNFETTKIGGLTIYYYSNYIAWVNRGILYTISGNTPFSSEQVQKIATSL